MGKQSQSKGKDLTERPKPNSLDPIKQELGWCFKFERVEAWRQALQNKYMAKKKMADSGVCLNFLASVFS